MAELWQSLTDDQIALLGCMAALAVAGAIMSLSYYIGRGRIAAMKRTAAQTTLLDSPAGRLQPTATQSAASRRTAA